MTLPSILIETFSPDESHDPLKSTRRKSTITVLRDFIVALIWYREWIRTVFIRTQQMNDWFLGKTIQNRPSCCGAYVKHAFTIKYAKKAATVASCLWKNGGRMRRNEGQNETYLIYRPPMSGLSRTATATRHRPAGRGARTVGRLQCNDPAGVRGVSEQMSAQSAVAESPPGQFSFHACRRASSSEVTRGII